MYSNVDHDLDDDDSDDDDDDDSNDNRMDYFCSDSMTGYTKPAQLLLLHHHIKN